MIVVLPLAVTLLRLEPFTLRLVNAEQALTLSSALFCTKFSAFRVVIEGLSNVNALGAADVVSMEMVLTDCPKVLV